MTHRFMNEQMDVIWRKTQEQAPNKLHRFTAEFTSVYFNVVPQNRTEYIVMNLSKITKLNVVYLSIFNLTVGY